MLAIVENQVKFTQYFLHDFLINTFESLIF